jgi:hypothetical protein
MALYSSPSLPGHLSLLAAVICSDQSVVGSDEVFNNRNTSYTFQAAAGGKWRL